MGQADTCVGVAHIHNIVRMVIDSKDQEVRTQYWITKIAVWVQK